MSMRGLISGCLAIVMFVPAVAGQALSTRERARPSYDAGLEHMRNEAFDAAADSFRAAVIIDPAYEMAHYMLGRVQLMQRQYAAATLSLEKARDVFSAQANTKQDTNQKRRDLIDDLSSVITRLEQTRNAQTPPVQEQIRQYKERQRQIQDLDRASGMTGEHAVPAFVWLSLGSAYFRSGKLSDAEHAYSAAIAADSKMGEAHNNLAVVYMETGRLTDADKAVKAAEKNGFRVSPALKEEIKNRKKM
jgi:tetratricopeptide (TPR) repeat protein